MKLKIALAAAAALVISAGTASAAPIVFSFETPSAGGYTYDPTVSYGDFFGDSGIQQNGSAWGFTAAPDGTQTAFLQINPNQSPGFAGSVELDVTGLTFGQTYNLSFYSESRPNYGTVDITIDGFGSFTPASTTAFTKVNAGNFVASGTSESFRFTATNPSATDSGAALDAVTISAAPEPGVWALMIAGLAMMGGALRLRRRQAGAVAA